MRRAAVLLAATLLPGCVDRRLPTPAVSTPLAFEAPTAGAGDARAIDRWWLLFGDSQLATLVDQALAAAPDARSALAALDEARAIRRQALTAYDPQGNITASVARSQTRITGLPAGAAGFVTVPSSAPTLSVGTDVSWELDLFGRRAAAREAADADLLAARFLYEGTRLSLAANVASGLIQARGLAAQADEARETLKIAQQLANVGRLRVEHGLGAAADAARFDTDLANARADLARIEAELTVAKRQLLVLIGRGTDPVASLVVTPDLPAPPQPPAITPGEAMARRPDVREAEARLRSAAGNLKLDELALLPRITLQPNASLTSITGAAGYATSVWSIAAGLAIPVLDRKRLLAEIDAQTARGQQAVIAYEKAVQTAYGEAENGLATLSADIARLRDLAIAEDRARYAFEAQRKGYDAGIVDLDTLLSTERTWRETRVALAGLRTSALIDAITAFKALGGGWTPAPAPERTSS